MKRSRTCMNLVELDAPAAPKRTCSLPNLAWNSPPASSIIPRQNHRDTLLFFQQHAASTLSRDAAIAAPPTAAAEGSFVVESIVRSKGSLNEITIVEGQQFFGEESGETAAPAVPQCSAAGGSPVALFGGAVHGSVFENCCDPIDYFCGVAASSDEVEEEGSTDAAAGATVSDGSDSGARFARQVSDADSSASASCARQISDASSSSSSNSGCCSSGDASSGGGGNIGYAFEGEAEADEADAVIATGSDAAYAAPASLSRSLPTLAAQPWGSNTLPVVAGPHAGGSWRPRMARGPRVKVRICSPRSGGGSGRRQRSMTVPPPWPPTVVPPLAVMNSWRDGPATTRIDNRQQQQQQQQRRRLRCLDVCDNDNEDGSVVSAVSLGFGLSDDVKMLIGMDRLRLVDPETASY